MKKLHDFLSIFDKTYISKTYDTFDNNNNDMRGQK